MLEEQAPPVVAVVVSSDPGPWLEECIASLLGQDYANLTTLVIDADSLEPLAPRIAAVAPDFYLRRLADNPGYGPSANVVLETVEGGTFFCFCHDDVVLAPDAIRRMVEESFRSNAGIVCPKLVDAADQSRILQLGLGVDRFGAPVRRVERGEFDQSQHDEAREVFAAPGACTLIRTDLFVALGGFDRQISMFGEDVDLCWRARIAGARVIVAPSATVTHLEATAARRRPLPEARALQWRHELRAVLKNYGRARRAFVVAQLLFFSVVEIAYFVLINKRWRARQVLDAWKWNLAAPRQLKSARAAVAEMRRLPDRTISRLFTRRTSRLWRFVRPPLEELALRWSRQRRDAKEVISERRAHRTARRREVSFGATIVAIFLVFGARSLFFGHLPLLGTFLPFSSSSHLLADFFGSHSGSILQSAGPVSPAEAMIGLVGIVFFGATNLAIKFALIGAIVLGAFGLVRLLRPYAPPIARLAGAVTYLFLPLAWNDVARADLSGLAAYCATPWILSRIARSADGDRFSDPDSRGAVVRQVLGFGLLLAVAGAFDPILVVVAFIAAVGFSGGSLFLGQEHSLRPIAVTGASVVVSFLLLFPWSLTLIQPGARWSVLSGAAQIPGRTPSLSRLFRFDLGPYGSGILGYALIVVALAVLVIGRRERLVWGVRWWFGALAVVAFAWICSEGWIGDGGGSLRVLVAPAAGCFAVLVGLGAAAAWTDVIGSLLTWRHGVTALFGIVGIAGLIPIAGAAFNGRFDLPSTGYDNVLSWTAASSAAPANETVWIGDPATLPLTSWQIRPGLAFGVANNGLPDGSKIWPSANPGVATGIANAFVAADSGRTVRLGSLLGAYGVRYVIVPNALAPVLIGTQTAPAAPAPQLLLDALSGQPQLRELPSEGGILVFQNTAWQRGAKLTPAIAGAGGTPGALRGVAVGCELLAWAAAIIFVTKRRRRDRERHARTRHDEHVVAAAELPPVEVEIADLVEVGEP